MGLEFPNALRERGHYAARVAKLDAEDLKRIARGMAHRSSGAITSRKNGVQVPWRNRVERDLMRLFDLDHDVLSFVSMPEKVNLILDGKQVRVVPAVRLRTHRGPMVVDVLHSNADPSDTRLAVLHAVRDTYAEKGVRYLWLKPRAVRLEPRLSNVTYARSFKDVVPDGAAQMRILDVLSAGRGEETVSSIRGVLGHEADGLFTMAMRRILRLDLSASSPAEMRVSFGEGGLIP